jgi:lipooligosaccharide transport system permease protein
MAPNIEFFNYPAFLLVTPMFMLSGTFFPLSRFPPAMQFLAQAILPLTHTVTLSRGLMFGNLESFLLISLAWIAVVTPFFFVLSINRMKKKLIK